MQIIAGRFSADHGRKFRPGDRSILREHRAQRVAAVPASAHASIVHRQHLIDRSAAALPNSAFVAVVSGRDTVRVETARPGWLEIQDKIRTVLNHDCDPIGVAGDVRDEYDSYIEEIYSLLQKRGSDEAIRIRHTQFGARASIAFDAAGDRRKGHRLQRPRHACVRHGRLLRSSVLIVPRSLRLQAGKDESLVQYMVRRGTAFSDLLRGRISGSRRIQDNRSRSPKQHRERARRGHTHRRRVDGVMEAAPARPPSACRRLHALNGRRRVPRFPSDGGYDVEITRIDRDGANWVVTYRERRPDPADIVTQIITMPPYHVVTIERFAGPVRFSHAG